MSHVDPTVLLLYAYGETPASEHNRIENHLADCAGCREQLREIELGREAAALTHAGTRRRKVPAVAVGLAAAAVLAVVWRGHDQRPREAPSLPWESRIASSTAGYVAGTGALAGVDSVLTSLEQELSHAAH